LDELQSFNSKVRSKKPFFCEKIFVFGLDCFLDSGFSTVAGCVQRLEKVVRINFKEIEKYRKEFFTPVVSKKKPSAKLQNQHSYFLGQFAVSKIQKAKIYELLHSTM